MYNNAADMQMNQLFFHVFDQFPCKRQVIFHVNDPKYLNELAS